ncbi:MAG: cyclophilin-like fold protein [Thermodesulfovibrionales bacterium]|nr:cyclophilin-like fold protein [Thermodesulfovibrionales bacterium]
MAKIRITIQDIVLMGELYQTRTAQAILEALPIEATPEEWGDEFYFEIPVQMQLDETATTRIKIGDIGYWPPGNALALFFGPTPISRGIDPVPASDVNLVGKILGDATVLKKVKGAVKVTLEKG